MADPVCPHCGKVTEGEPHDSDMYVIVMCTECATILAVLPKFFQKCTWKRSPPGEEAEVEEPLREIKPPAPRNRRRDARKKTAWD